MGSKLSHAVTQAGKEVTEIIYRVFRKSIKYTTFDIKMT